MKFLQILFISLILLKCLAYKHHIAIKGKYRHKKFKRNGPKQILVETKTKLGTKDINFWQLSVQDERQAFEPVDEKVDVTLRKHSIGFIFVNREREDFDKDKLSKYFFTPSQSTTMLKDYANLLAYSKTIVKENYYQKKLKAEMDELKLNEDTYVIPYRLIPNCEFKFEENAKNDDSQYAGKTNFLSFSVKLDESIFETSNYENSHHLAKVELRISEDDQETEIQQSVLDLLKKLCNDNKSLIEKNLNDYITEFKNLKQFKENEIQKQSLEKEMIDVMDKIKMKINGLGKIFTSFSPLPNVLKFINDDIGNKQRGKSFSSFPMIPDIPELEFN